MSNLFKSHNENLSSKLFYQQQQQRDNNFVENFKVGLSKTNTTQQQQHNNNNTTTKTTSINTTSSKVMMNPYQQQQQRNILHDINTNRSQAAIVQQKNVHTVAIKTKKQYQPKTVEHYVPRDFHSKQFNIDQYDVEDFTQYSDYVNEVYRYLFSLEKVYHIRSNFISTQTDITEKMRSIVVDWLVQVQNRFRMLPETLQLTVRIMDLYLSKVVIRRNELQLLAVTSMLIAAKYEEMFFPEIADFVYITNKAYTAEQIIEMEIIVLTTLDFSVGIPIPLQYLRRFSKSIEATSRTHKMAKYFLEISLLNSSMSAVPPSVLAAAALNLASKLLKDCIWNECVCHYSTYTDRFLLKYVKNIANLVHHNEQSNLKSIRKKYADKQYDCISDHKAFQSTLFQQLTLS